MQAQPGDGVLFGVCAVRRKEEYGSEQIHKVAHGKHQAGRGLHAGYAIIPSSASHQTDPHAESFGFFTPPCSVVPFAIALPAIANPDIFLKTIGVQGRRLRERSGAPKPGALYLTASRKRAGFVNSGFRAEKAGISPAAGKRWVAQGCPSAWTLPPLSENRASLTGHVLPD